MKMDFNSIENEKFGCEKGTLQKNSQRKHPGFA